MEFFLSESNVRNQSRRLERLLEKSDNLNIRDDPHARKKCLRLIARQMEEVYRKYGKKKPRKISSREYLDLMNNKSIEYSVKLCNKNRRKKTKSRQRTKKNNNFGSTQLGQLSRSRAQEVYGNRRLIVENRPRPTATNRGSVSSGMPAYSDGSGMVGHAPYSVNSTGDYTIINGGINRQPQFTQFTQKKNKDDVSRQYFARREAYGIDNNRRERPADINFCVDGGDSRGSGDAGGNNGNEINTTGLDGKGMMGLESNGLNNMAAFDGNYGSFNNNNNNQQMLNKNNMLNNQQTNIQQINNQQTNNQQTNNQQTNNQQTNNQQTNNQQMNMVRMIMSMINNNNNGNNNGYNNGNNNEAMIRAAINNISNNQNTQQPQQLQQPSQEFNNIPTNNNINMQQ
uniref:Uncharacterized protein n=1 Tax=Mimivirus LCMiAC01 TaxID=2506608 RepID=A0A481Z085_9VIRU|nr:MAG: hypothetical protein LCMiAC01_01540 [Mimivirus LCMiAC01]